MNKMAFSHSQSDLSLSLLKNKLTEISPFHNDSNIVCWSPFDTSLSVQILNQCQLKNNKESCTDIKDLKKWALLYWNLLETFGKYNYVGCTTE